MIRRKPSRFFAVEYFGPPPTSNQNSQTKLSAELREEFLVARDKFEESGSADFSNAEFLIMHMRKIDIGNSAVWYFAGEIKRIKKSEWFTAKSCIKSNGRNRDLTGYQQDFNRYIDDAKAASFKDIGNTLDSSSCYENKRGFCPQRIAWIHHLLANDFFEQSQTVLDQPEKIGRLELVLQHSAEALKYEHEGRRGFVQCMDTVVLQEKAREQMSHMSGLDAR